MVSLGEVIRALMASVVWVTTVGLWILLLSPVRWSWMVAPMLVMGALSVVLARTWARRDGFKQLCREYLLFVMAAGGIAFVGVTNVAVPVGVGRLALTVVWLGVVPLVLVTIGGMMWDTRRRPSGAIAPLALLAVGWFVAANAAQSLNETGLRWQLEIGGYEQRAASALANHQLDPAADQSDDVFVGTNELGDRSVAFPMVSGILGRQTGAVYIAEPVADGGELFTRPDRRANLWHLEGCTFLGGAWYWCRVN